MSKLEAIWSFVGQFTCIHVRCWDSKNVYWIQFNSFLFQKHDMGSMNFISIHFVLMGYQMLWMASKISYDKLSYSSLHPIKLRQIIGMNIILLEKYNTVCIELVNAACVWILLGNLIPHKKLYLSFIPQDN